MKKCDLGIQIKWVNMKSGKYLYETVWFGDSDKMGQRELLYTSNIQNLNLAQFELLQVVGHGHIDGLVQDCSNSSALAMELLQSCAKALAMFG